jgi:hypothetical protein
MAQTAQAARTVEIRDRALAGRWLAGGLVLERLARPTTSSVREVAPWLQATLGEIPAIPSAGMVADLGRLLHGAALDLNQALAPDDRRLRAALHAYEDQVLGRLAADRRLEAAAHAVARLPAALRPQAVGVTVAALLQRLGGVTRGAMTPALARQIAARPVEELLQNGLSSVSDPGPARELLIDGYESLARAARQSRTLLTDADVFVLEHLSVLGTLAQRLLSQEVAAAAEALTAPLPRRLPFRRRPAGTRATRLEDESAYPIGGFSSIGTVGSLENLVTSELIYMDDPSDVPRGAEPASLVGGAGGSEPAEGSDEIDLFDMRYVEGELLYYTRDEAIHVRTRRVISILVGPSLVEARWKDPELPWQRLTLALAIVLGLVRVLAEWLGDEELRFRVIFLRDGACLSPLGAERELLGLLLGEWRDRGMVDVEEGELAAEVAAMGQAARRALVDAIALGVEAAPRPEGLDRRVTWAALRLGGAAGAPIFDPGNDAEAARETGSDDDDAALKSWQDGLRALLRHLL